MPITRNVDPDANKARSKVGVAARRGDKQAERQARQELLDANMMAMARKVAAQLPELTPEKREQIRALLAGA